jgi:phage repressor protein C with HTH and peptisase S24 domain
MENEKEKINNPIINERFCQLYKQMREMGMIKNKSRLAEKLGTYNHVINNIMKKERNLTIEQIHKLVDLFNVNVNYLFGRSDIMFGSDADHVEDQALRVTEKIVEGRNNITLVPQKAMAGYAMSLGTTDYLSQFNRFSVPNMEGNLIAFEISGDSMMPNITSGDYVICEAIERGEPLKDNAVYVVVTDSVVAKRIQQVKENNDLVRLRLISDNAPTYQPYEVELDEVRQILRVKARMTNHGIA